VTQVAPDFQAILLLSNPLCNQLKKIFPRKFLAQIFRGKKNQESERKNSLRPGRKNFLRALKDKIWIWSSEKIFFFENNRRK